MAILLVILVVVTTLAAAIVYLVLLAQSLATRIWMPGAFGLIIGAAAILSQSRLPLPTPIRVVQLPILMAAIAACLTTKRKQWKLIINAELRATTPQIIVIFLFTSVGFIVGACSGIGKPVLIALGQDVIGILPSERREIEISGAIFVAGIGAMLGVLAASRFAIVKNNGS